MAATAITVGLVAYGLYQTNESIEASKDANRAQKRANEIATAQGEVNDINQRKEQLRASRVRRAQILQASKNLGVSESSGESGSLSALGTAVSSANAAIRGSANTNNAISMFNQKAADFTSSANMHSAYANLAFQGASMSAQAIKPTGTPSANNLSPDYALNTTNGYGNNVA